LKRRVRIVTGGDQFPAQCQNRTIAVPDDATGAGGVVAGNFGVDAI
jgi:hypothetical protein